MEQQRKVQTIPATLTRFTATPLSAQKKRKVAGYARVSTDHDDQFTSYEAQIDYYTNYIKGRDDWEFVSVYTDEGITGTSTKHREGFKRMIADALDGKIDLIVTKSVSRFARNTVDSLTTIRQLKENGIEVYFEKENIWTFDGKGEVLLTIMSSLAQEESRSISENCTWGQRKRFADGKVTVPFKRFLGYDRGEDGNLVINPEQAEVVKRIYGMFLKGMTPHGIAKTLTDEGVPTPAGKHQWGQTTIKSILSNEKYKGDALLQKTFCEDFLTKKMKTNQGEVPQYYVENNHEAIIDPETFEMVQRELARRTKGKNRHSGVHLLSGRIKCGDCGGWYGSKVWHSPEKCKRTVWQCNQKYKNEVRCTTPYLDEASVKERFTVAVNQLLAGRDAAIAAYEIGMAKALDTTELEAQQQELLSEMEVLNGMIQQMIRQNAAVAQDQTEYNQRFDALSQKFKAAEAKKDAVAQQISDIRDRRGTFGCLLHLFIIDDPERMVLKGMYRIQRQHDHMLSGFLSALLRGEDVIVAAQADVCAFFRHWSLPPSSDFDMPPRPYPSDHEGRCFCLPR